MQLLSLYCSQSSADLSSTVILGRFVSRLTIVPSFETDLGLLTPPRGSEGPVSEGTDSEVPVSEGVVSEGTAEETSDSVLSVRDIQGADSLRLFLFPLAEL